MNRQQDELRIASQKRVLIRIREEAELVAAFLRMQSGLSWQ